jgi:hypothetical protein
MRSTPSLRNCPQTTNTDPFHFPAGNFLTCSAIIVSSVSGNRLRANNMIESMTGRSRPDFRAVAMLRTAHRSFGRSAFKLQRGQVKRDTSEPRKLHWRFMQRSSKGSSQENSSRREFPLNYQRMKKRQSERLPARRCRQRQSSALPASRGESGQHTERISNTAKPRRVETGLIGQQTPLRKAEGSSRRTPSRSIRVSYDRSLLFIRGKMVVISNEAAVG